MGDREVRWEGHREGVGWEVGKEGGRVRGT